MKYLIGFLSLLLPLLSVGQNVYPLHPAIGDTINLDEKLDYSLFPEVTNNGFKFAIIAYAEGGFRLVYNITTADSTLPLTEMKMDLSQEKIIEEQQKIQKINAYYRYLAEEAKKPKQQEYEVADKAIPIRFDGPISEQLRKESRMKARLVEDQRRMEDFEMGLRPREIGLRLGPW
jgi:hypothetical protein